MNKKILQPHLIDINTSHSLDFKIDRDKDPHGYNLIMCFRTPAVILTNAGVETARPGDCIIHSLDFRQYHGSAPGTAESFRNDWLHVLPETLIPLINALQLPWDTLLSTEQPEILTPYIKRLKEEMTVNDNFSERAIINQIDDMLLTTARSYRKMLMLRDELTAAERRYFPDFVALRANMLEDCRNNIIIKTLAARVNLSQERFAALYRKFFNSTPHAELIDARLVLARRMLQNTFMEIKEISAACGWEDIHYFSRLFKKKIGISPSQYRHQALRK
jgi:AraC-like DNA-binding protein